MKTNLESQLELTNLSLNIHLGITQEERQETQDVKVDIKITNNQLPNGCKTDNINDTICYDILCKKINEKFEKSTFNLIENLCKEILYLIKNEVEDKAKEITVSIKKNPPIQNLSMATFSITHKNNY